MVWVDNSRILAILAVVILHVAATVVSGMSNLSSSQWWIGNIYDAIVRWCVPVFVMLSGALLLSDNKTESISSFYKKRVARLLVPILFWSLFFLVWTFFKGKIKGSSPSLLLLGKILLSGRPYDHMWFLYMIIGLYFVTPFVRILIRITPKKELNLFVVSIFLIAVLNEIYNAFFDIKDGFFIKWFLIYLPYFITGHLIDTSESKLSKKVVLLIFSLSVILTAWGCFLLGEYGGLAKGLYFYNYLSVTVIPMSICTMFIFKEMTKPLIGIKFVRYFSNMVLGIYLIHPIIIDLLKFSGVNVIDYNVLISIPLISLWVFIMSSLVVWIIQHIPFINKIV
jgi:surface polysaccharide O-acyltransferase-like enzyme